MGLHPAKPLNKALWAVQLDPARAMARQRRGPVEWSYSHVLCRMEDRRVQADSETARRTALLDIRMPKIGEKAPQPKSFTGRRAGGGT